MGKSWLYACHFQHVNTTTVLESGCLQEIDLQRTRSDPKEPYVTLQKRMFKGNIISASPMSVVRVTVGTASQGKVGLEWVRVRVRWD